MGGWGGGGVCITGITMVDVSEGRAIREEHDLGRRNSRSALWIPHNTSGTDSTNYMKCVSNFPSLTVAFI